MAQGLGETLRGSGLALAPAFAVTDDIASGRLVRVDGQGTQAEGMWNAMTLSGHSPVSAAANLCRFITTPRATQAMLNGSGANIGHIKPSVHITLWT